MKLKLYCEAKIKPTKINKTIVKLLIKEYPILEQIKFFQTKKTSTGDVIYILDFDKVTLVACNGYHYFSINGIEYENLTLTIDGDEYHINSNHWKTKELKQKREIIAFENKKFNIEIDNAVDKTKDIIDKLEYRIKKLRKIDWKV